MPVAVIAFLRSPLAKWIGGGLAIILALWFAVHQFNNYKARLIEEGRQTGRAEVTKEFQAVVDENNRVNRAVEQRVDTALNSFTDRLQKTLDKVRGQSAEIAGDIINNIDRRPEVFKNPVCETPQDTIDARNRIRALGPKPAVQVPSQAGDPQGSKRFSDGSITRADGSVSIPIPAAIPAGE